MARRLEASAVAWACAAIIAGYFWCAYPAVPQYGLFDPSQQHFNQLVAGFRSGQLSLKQSPAPEMARLADPYDPAQNGDYRLHDASYFHGRYFIYYGVTPALILFWPYVALTGHYLAQKYAVAIFCSLGLLIGAALIREIRRECYPGIGTGVLVASVVAFGTVSGVAFLVRRPEMYEVSISCAYAMTVAALAALWRSLDSRRNALPWTALASLLFGLAVAARPTFVFGAAAVLIPVAFMREEVGRQWKRVAAACVPLACIGTGLATYNFLRFGNPTEFGIKYLLMGQRVTRFFSFDWGCIWLNARLYFALPTRLSPYFPFVRGVEIPPLPAGYAFTQNPFGVFTNIPFLLLALAAPLGWSLPDPASARRLRLFMAALAWVSLTSAAILLVYVVACIRYEVDFTPYLTVLAVLGVFGIEGRLAGRPGRRAWARLGWGAALAASVAFNFFGSCAHMDVLKKDAPAQFRALAAFFDYPAYALNRAGASSGGVPAKDATGPVLLQVSLPPGAAGGRQPLLALGSDRESGVVVFIRRSAEDVVSVGFDFSGTRLFECLPIRVDPKVPLRIGIYAPQFLPHPGDPGWGSVPYRRQLSGLGMYAITVNGVVALRGDSPFDGPIEGGGPLVVGSDPYAFPSVDARLAGRILTVSRISPAGGLLGE
jgi:hypothetical protein